MGWPDLRLSPIDLTELEPVGFPQAADATDLGWYWRVGDVPEDASRTPDTDW